MLGCTYSETLLIGSSLGPIKHLLNDEMPLLMRLQSVCEIYHNNKVALLKRVNSIFYSQPHTYVHVVLCSFVKWSK